MLPAELHQAVASHMLERDAYQLAQASSALRRSLCDHYDAYLLTKRASTVTSLRDVLAVLGCGSSGRFAVDDNPRKNVLALPRSLQLAPLRGLNLKLLFVSPDEQAQAAVVLAKHTVAPEVDPLAAMYLTNAIKTLAASSEAATALKILWDPVHTMPVARRTIPLFSLSMALPFFPLDERVTRFAAHLTAWEEIVAADPRSMKSTPSWISPLDAVLPNFLEQLSPSDQDEPRGRIIAMKHKVDSATTV